VQVRGRDDHAHAALAEDVLDAVLPGQDLARDDGLAHDEAPG
jgi:hypothetical protein